MPFYNTASVDYDIVAFNEHILTSDDFDYEVRQDELDELKSQLAEWES